MYFQKSIFVLCFYCSIDRTEENYISADRINVSLQELLLEDPVITPCMDFQFSVWWTLLNAPSDQDPSGSTCDSPVLKAGMGNTMLKEHVK